MSEYRSTVIMKTDIRGFTTRVGMMSTSDLSKLLSEHKKLILEKIVKYGGQTVKGEGDSFWLIFPSVTSACLAAFDIQQDVLESQAGKSDESRLAIRIVVTLGDVLHQEKDIFGDAVNLAARIETITPHDEIYISQAAWLAINKAEIKTAYVNDFNFKGFPTPNSVYKVVQDHKTRMIENQVIVFTELLRFVHFSEEANIKQVEELLMKNDELHNLICREYGGIIRLILGDLYFLTFENAEKAVTGLINLQRMWDNYIKNNGFPFEIKMSVGIHKGTFYLFRSLLFGRDVNLASKIQVIAAKTVGMCSHPLLISPEVFAELSNTDLEKYAKKADFPSDILKVKGRDEPLVVYHFPEFGQ